MLPHTERIVMNNLYMIFRYNTDGEIDTFSTVITQKAFDTFIGSNQPNEARLSEEKVTLPSNMLGGSTRPALVHYMAEKKFAAYVPVFATQAEVKAYLAAFGR